MSAPLAVLGVLLAVGGVVLLAIALSALGNATRFGVPAPLRWRRMRLAGAVLLLVGIVLVIAARFA